MRYRIICLSALLTLVFAKSFAVNNLNNKVEFRAAWIATVANIDWPLAGCTDTDKQQQHMIQLLDSLQRLNFNAVIFQIRPTADAFYQSDLEPWSRFLTGKQGQEPDPYYDPRFCYPRGS